MKTIVAYKSKSGFTKTYAQWIARELGCDLKENPALSDISDYDTVIYGGGLYACNINGMRLITGNMNKLRDKNLIIFAVGSNPGREENIKKLWDFALTPDQRKVIKTFYLRGGFDYSKLSSTNKVLMSLLKKRLEHMSDPGEDEKGLLEAYNKPQDFTDKENIKAVTEYVLSLNK
ncbi:MAG: flavodoxin domain-containing protein [Oscillospiraceae bacterium]|nr:flavodoxin domain-containing protein [Oscillospiraceae bacterium]